MRLSETKRAAVGRTATVIVIIVLLVVAAGAAYFLTQPASKTTTVGSSSSTSTTSSTTSISQSSTSTSSSSTTSSSSSTSSIRDTLVVDDVFWPAGDFNQLNALGEIPYPNWLALTTYQTLVTENASALYNGGTIQFLPMLASNWTISSDGTTYTFNLRQGITFSNGDPLNAYQIWAQMYGLYFLSGNSSSWLESYNVFDLSQVQFGQSSISLLNSTGLINPTGQAQAMMMKTSWPIYVTSPNQIVFHLKAPFNYFLGTLVAYCGLIFDTQWLLHNGGFGSPAAFNPYFNQHPIPGTGPYMVTQISENSFIKLAQNPTYWAKDFTRAQISANPYLDPGHARNVIVNAKFDDVSRYVDLTNGQAQIAGILAQNWPLIINQPDKYSYFHFPPTSTVFVGISMNTQRYPTNITAVRQAIVHAINYTDISEKVFFGGLNRMVGPEYPAWKQFYDLGNLPPYQYNLSLAQQILSQNHIDTSKFPLLEFRVVAGCSYCIDAAQIVQADLGLIGININVEVTPSSQYAIPLTGGTGSYTAALQAAQTISHLTWYGTGTFAPGAATPADNWLLSVSNQTASNNWAIYSHPVVQACVNAWTTTSDTSLLTNICTKAQQQIYNDAPYIWLGTLKLFFGAGSIVWNKQVVKSFYTDPLFSGASSTVIFNTVQFGS